MRKDRFILLSALVAIFLCGVLVPFFLPGEPVYQDHPLGYWLDLYSKYTPDNHSRLAADDAIRQIGTNALPFLLVKIQAHDSTVSHKIMDLLQRHRVFRLTFTRAEEQQREALLAFSALGVSASNAVPELIKIYQRSPSESLRQYIMSTLAAIGDGAKVGIPFFTGLASSANREERLTGLRALAHIHSEPQVIIPVLVKSLTDPDSEVRLTSAMGLAEFGPVAKAAVPALITMLHDSVPMVRVRAMITLAQSGGDPAVVTPALLEALQDTNNAIRFQAAQALGACSSDLKPAVMVMIDLLQNQYVTFGNGTATALGRWHVEPDLAVPALIAALNSNGASNEQTQTAIIDALGNFGAAAKSALPTLRILAGVIDFPATDATSAAIKKISLAISGE